MEKFTFKLPQDKCDIDTVNTTVDDEACDFMILSYACHSSIWSQYDCHPPPLEEDKECPLTPVMWHAFLEQRLSPTEPYWIDFPLYHANLRSREDFR